MNGAELSVFVSAHVEARTEIRARIHPRENRVVIRLLGAGLCEVGLFTDRPELVRLRDALTDALAELDEQQAAFAAQTPERDSAA
ncbi:hypothetical protein [Pseudonocardia nigra]|uniref:hypothetical protein n=1 Tax=Pseudonocardia nigra TaxID=1921578 RepID=UPI001C5EF406|nr:hypothetical protein [Pseudonocardia nigra]